MMYAVYAAPAAHDEDVVYSLFTTSNKIQTLQVFCVNGNLKS